MICGSRSSVVAETCTFERTSRVARSSSRAFWSAARSSAVSHVASRMCDFSSSQLAPHSATENIPSIRNIHCQPCRPKPWIDSSAPVTGPDSTDANAEPPRKIAIALPRSCGGSHCDRYSTTPGKKPASAAPSRKRSA